MQKKLLLNPNEVAFLDQALVKKVYEKITQILAHVETDEMRFSWVSNRTLGLIFELDRSDVEDGLEESLDDLIDRLEDEFKLLITVYFE